MLGFVDLIPRVHMAAYNCRTIDGDIHGGHNHVQCSAASEWGVSAGNNCHAFLGKIVVRFRGKLGLPLRQDAAVSQ
jgi:hypothetical protein